MKILYLDCFAGIAGDMTVASLSSLAGLNDEVLTALSKLKLGTHVDHRDRNKPEFEAVYKETQKNGMQSTLFDVTCKEEHAHRDLGIVRKLLLNSSLPKEVIDSSIKVFEILAQAEGRVHGMTPESVHFHEVGAVDSIVDIVAACYCFYKIPYDKCVVSTVREGSGFVMSQHGKIPVPAPAVAELFKLSGAVVEQTDVKGEMVTPTGAALLAVFADEYGKSCPKGKITAIGAGAGHKNFEHPNILRSMLVETIESADDISVLETNIDDMTGEALSFAMEKLFEAGALDVFFTQVIMKKNRPGIVLTVLCKKQLEAGMIREIFTHTSTIGIRVKSSERAVCERRFEKVVTSLGEITSKISSFDGIVRHAPEYEDMKCIAYSKNLPIKKVEELYNLAKMQDDSL